MTLADRARAEAERPTIELARFIAAWDQGVESTDRIPHWAVNLAMALRERHAAQEPTPEQVEAAARAWAAGGPTPGNWDNMAERLRGMVSDRMRRALIAAQEAGR